MKFWKWINKTFLNSARTIPMWLIFCPQNSWSWLKFPLVYLKSLHELNICIRYKISLYQNFAFDFQNITNQNKCIGRKGHIFCIDKGNFANVMVSAKINEFLNTHYKVVYTISKFMKDEIHADWEINLATFGKFNLVYMGRITGSMVINFANNWWLPALIIYFNIE